MLGDNRNFIRSIKEIESPRQPEVKHNRDLVLYAYFRIYGKKEVSLSDLDKGFHFDLPDEKQLLVKLPINEGVIPETKALHIGVRL